MKQQWLKLNSNRTQPYTMDDITVVIPSAYNKFINRWDWFWPQYVENTHPDVVKRTIVSCDKEEEQFFTDMGITNLVFAEPKWIVYKTIAALDHITTRLTFRLANDIMIVREGWEEILLEQFNAEEKLQIIAEVQHGTSFPSSLQKLQRDWEYLKREYPRATTASVYPHGSRIFSQTAVWNAYYRNVLRYTPHDHDEIYLSQLARADGTQFTNFRGINLYLAHVGISSRDFSEEYIKGHIEERRAELNKQELKHEFVKMV